MENYELRFLNIFRSALSNNKYLNTTEIADSELNYIFRLAENHRILPMIMNAIYEDNNTPAIQKRLRKAVTVTCKQAHRTAGFLDLYRFLSQHDLNAIVMKGITCRNLYPQPEQRPSSDEDLLINNEDFVRFHKAFNEYGLHPALPEMDIYKEHEVPYTNGKIYIELHKKPFSPESKAFSELNKYFTDVQDHSIDQVIYGVPIKTMNHTDHLFYQICHAYKHFINCGIGIRLVSDIVLYSSTFEKNIDWQYITERCHDIHAYQFVSALFRIGEIYLFPDRLSDHLKEIWHTGNIDEAALLDDILAGGLYGTSSEDRLHSANLTLGAAENAQTGSHSKIWIRSLFPSFDSMKARYAYLNKYPFLLPAAWMQRISKYGKNSLFRKNSNNHASEVIKIGKERIGLLYKYQIIDDNRS